jgi:hypothetical protein
MGLGIFFGNWISSFDWFNTHFKYIKKKPNFLGTIFNDVAVLSHKLTNLYGSSDPFWELIHYQH